MAEKTNFGFPFAVDAAGRIPVQGGREALQGKILQVLFTTPGERVHQPDFGCGLFNLAFEPNDSVLAAAVEFTVGQALARWLGDDLTVDAVNVAAAEEQALVEIVYTRKRDLAQQALRVRFR